MPAYTLSTDKVKRLAAFLASRQYSSKTELAKVLGISRTTANKYSRLFENSGQALGDIALLSPKEIRAALFVEHRANFVSGRFTELVSIFPDITLSVSTREKTLLDCWSNYRTSHPHGYGYSQFVHRYHEWGETNSRTYAPVINKWKISQIPAADRIALESWRRSNSRTRWCKSVALLELEKGTPITSISSKLEKSPRIIGRWRREYLDFGLAGLQMQLPKKQSPASLDEIKRKQDQVIALLHESPALHGINRASWSLKTLAQAFETKHRTSIGISTLSEYIRGKGYSFKKARKVLTSPDPEYLIKLERITEILSNLGPDEAFFSIDEFGPFSVKIQGGRSYQLRGSTQTFPQWQNSKGRLILTGALELSSNHLTHFYSEKKNTDEMIKLLDILLVEYCNSRTLYLSWDAASWHISTKLTKRVADLNAIANTGGHRPLVKLAPLPASAQFLNVIESVFSGMSKAIIHNSKYENVDHCKDALNAYIADRNVFYKANPKRAGNKIWGKEITAPDFSPSNNCKDPSWR